MRFLVPCGRLSWFLRAFDRMLISHYYLLTYLGLQTDKQTDGQTDWHDNSIGLHALKLMHSDSMQRDKVTWTQRNDRLTADGHFGPFHWLGYTNDHGKYTVSYSSWVATVTTSPGSPRYWQHMFFGLKHGWPLLWPWPRWLVGRLFIHEINTRRMPLASVLQLLGRQNNALSDVHRESKKGDTILLSTSSLIVDRFL